METIILIAWLGLIGALVSQDINKKPETLYKVEECDDKGKCKTIIEVKEEE